MKLKAITVGVPQVSKARNERGYGCLSVRRCNRFRERFRLL